MTNFILVGDPRRPGMTRLGGALVSPEAPPPPAITAEPEPLKAWEAPRAPEAGLPKKDEPRLLFAMILRQCGGGYEVEVYETEQQRNDAYHTLLDQLREPGEEHVSYDELEERDLCGCGDAQIYLTDAPLGGVREMERHFALKKHFECEVGRMEVEEVRCRAP